MARKEINIFGTSFLDLLSGALGAVIILFIIVPKMTRSEQDVLNKVKELEVVAGNINEILDKLENTVPRDVLEQIEKELSDLKRHTETLQNELVELKEEVKALQEENESLKQQAAEKDKELEELREKVSETVKQLEKAKERSSAANTVEKTLGVFAKFGILCRWGETETDVDIGVQKFGGTPEQCWWNWPSHPWGNLGEDVRERAVDEEERFELFYVPKIYPDTYTAWVCIYERSQGRMANVTATLIFHPNKNDEIRKEFGPILLSNTAQHCFVTFRLTESGFEILPHREPLWGNTPSYK